MVVDTSEAQTDLIFAALADPTRRDIVRRALHGEHSVSSLARSYPMSFAAVQKHVAVLHRAGLVTKQRRGREQLVTSEIGAIRDASSLLAQFEDLWRNRFDRMHDLINDSPTEGTKP